VVPDVSGLTDEIDYDAVTAELMADTAKKEEKSD
jgi:hypothetical protein